MLQHGGVAEVLIRIPRFCSFQDQISVPDSSSLSRHDLFKINKLIDDIYDHLTTLQLTFTSQLRNTDKHHLLWLCNGKRLIMELIHDSESIDSLISQLLVAAESLPPAKLDAVLTKVESTSDLLLNVKRDYIVLKRKIDIAINYQEINDNIIGSLRQEIESCADEFRQLLQARLSSPKRHLPKFNLESITARMKINDLTNPSTPSFSLSTRSLRLPTFNDADEELYNAYLSLESRILPLKVSMDFLPMKIEEFKHASASVFPLAVEEVERAFNLLVETWTYLQHELDKLRHDSVESRWVEIFTYLILEISFKCDELIMTLNSTRDIDLVGPTYKLCSNTITLIRKAFSESTVADAALAGEFNNHLLSKWQSLNDLLLSTPKTEMMTPRSSTLDESGLRSFHTSKRGSLLRSVKLSSPHEPLDSISENSPSRPLRSITNSPSLGLDLGVSVDQTKVPFSIEQKNKVRDFFPDRHMELKRKNIKHSLMKLNGMDVEEDDDDEKTLVHATPKLPYEFDSQFLDGSRFTLCNSLDRVQTRNSDIERLDVHKVFAKLMELNGMPTKLPLIKPNYVALGYKVIKKAVSHDSRIPTISPNHPVFQSPVKLPQKAPQPGLEPPLFALKRRSLLGPTKLAFPPIEEVPKVPGVRRDSDAKVRRDSEVFGRLSGISLSKTPQLTYVPRSPMRSFSDSGLPGRRRVLLLNLSPSQLLTSPRSDHLVSSIRSSSPERPDSSLGNRFDEIHLLPVTNRTKKPWR